LRVNEFDIFFENTGNALEIIGGLPSSYFYRFLGFESSFIMATGVRSADENYAWIKSNSYSRQLLIDVIERFNSKSLQFIWPVFPDSGVQMGLDLDEAGLLTRDTFSAMIFDSDVDSVCRISKSDLKLRTTRALTLSDATLWANACWSGFSEGSAAEPEFIRFAQNAILSDKLRLVLGYVNNEPVGSYMLCEAKGIYISHFNVLSKWRNFGIGSFLMDEIMNYSNSISNRFLVLLATRPGKKLYEKFGFRNIAEIPIRSFYDIS